MRLSKTWLKLLRDIRTSRWQFLAVGLVVALGVALFIGAYNSYQNLRTSYDRSYQELRMADLWFRVDDAPEAVVSQIEALAGVRAAQGRIVTELPITLPKAGPGRILGRLVSLPGEHRPAVNNVKVVEGDYFSPERGRQVLLEQSFADYHEVGPGDSLQVLPPAGEPLTFTVAGIAASPEYLWVAKSERELFVLPTTFGVIFVPHDQAEALAGNPDRVNDIAVLLADDADVSRVESQIVDILRPYGLGEIIPRDRQLSNRLLRLDLDGFQSLAIVFPVLFLAVAALAIYTLLNRLVQGQRAHIGLMRAIGYSRRQVLVHYLGFSLLVGALGALAGVGFGFLLSVLVTRLYGTFLNIPFVEIRANWGVMAIGFAAGVLAALLAGLVPAWSSASIRPAEAMRPPLPTAGRRTMIERALPFLSRLAFTWKLPLRNLFRAHRRTLYTAAGVASGVSLILVTASFMDSYDAAMNLQFRRIQNYDARLDFVQPQPVELAEEVAAWDGVAAAEPVFAAPVALSAADREQVTLLQGLAPGGNLYRTYTPSGDRIRVGDGIILTSALTNVLDVGKGDTLKIRPLFGAGPGTTVTVDNIAQQPMGDVAFASLERAQAMAGETAEATALLVSFDGPPSSELESRLYSLPGVASIEFTEDLRGFISELMRLFLVFMSIMLAFGVALGFAIIFNTIYINVIERRRELATMRTIGTNMGKLVTILTVENVLMSLLGVVIGLPLGYGLSLYFASLYNNDLISMPTVIYLRTYGIAGLGALLVLLLAEVPAIWHVRRLNLAATVREMAT